MVCLQTWLSVSEAKTMQQDSVGWWRWWNHKKFFLSKYKCLQICTSFVMGRKLHVHLHILLPTYISLCFFSSIFCFSSLSWSGKCWTKLQQTVTIQPKFASSLTVINADTWIVISLLNSHTWIMMSWSSSCAYTSMLTLESWCHDLPPVLTLESSSLTLESWSLLPVHLSHDHLHLNHDLWFRVLLESSLFHFWFRWVVQYQTAPHKMGSISSLLAGWSFPSGIHEEYFQGSQRMESNSLSQHRNTTAAASGFGRH